MLDPGDGLSHSELCSALRDVIGQRLTSAASLWEGGHRGKLPLVRKALWTAEVGQLVRRGRIFCRLRLPHHLVRRLSATKQYVRPASHLQRLGRMNFRRLWVDCSMLTAPASSSQPLIGTWPSRPSTALLAAISNNRSHRLQPTRGLQTSPHPAMLTMRLDNASMGPVNRGQPYPTTPQWIRVTWIASCSLLGERIHRLPPSALTARVALKRGIAQSQVSAAKRRSASPNALSTRSSRNNARSQMAQG